MTETVFPGEIRDIRPDLHLIDWTPESLKATRVKLGLKQEEVANVVGVSKAAVSNLERNYTTNPWALQMYGIILERYYAHLNGYIPAYRKIGENNYAEEMHDFNREAD